MKTDIGKNIEKIRISKGLKQSDIADKLNIDNSNYSRLEKKGNKISFDILERVADVLNVDIREILGISLPKNDSLEVEQLKKRNEELEDRIKDKEFILLSNSQKLNDFKNELLDFFLKIVAMSVYNEGLSILVTYNKKTKKKFEQSVHNREILTFFLDPIEKEKWEYLIGAYDSYEDISRKFIIPDALYEKAINKYFFDKVGDDSEICELFKILADYNLIDDDVIKEAVNKYWDLETNGFDEGEDYDENLNRVKV